jgi:SAM-dependent methyltransferase
VNKTNDDAQFQSYYWQTMGPVDRRAPDHPMVRKIVASKLNAISAHVPLHGKILEIGCGNGHFSYWLSKTANVVASDFSYEMLRINPVRQKVVMDGRYLGFFDNSFDIVMSSQLLHHVDDPSYVISEMKRVSKKYIVIIEPNRNNPLMLLLALTQRSERKAIRFSRGYMERLARQNGFQNIRIFSHGCLPPNKTPALLAPLAKYVECCHPIGLDIVVIAEKDS